MNKQSFAEYISNNTNISPSQADIIIDVFTSNLTQAIFEGNPVNLDEFGTFIPSTKIQSKNKLVTKYSPQKPSANNNIIFVPGSILSNNI